MKEKHYLERTDPLFTVKLRKSRAAVRKVAKHIGEQEGVEPYLPPEFTRKDVYHRKEGNDGGDFWIGNSRREVKHKFKVWFDSVDKYPWWRVFLDETFRVDAYAPKPDFFYIVAKDLSGMLKVDVALTRFAWDSAEVTEKEWYGGELCCKDMIVYRVPKILCVYEAL